MSWASAQHVLCVRLDYIGDVLMTTPAFRALKEGNMNRRLTLLTSSRGAGVAHLIPEIDDVVVYDAPWLKDTAARTDSRAEEAMIAELRRRQLDAAVIFTVYSQNPLPAAMMCYLAGIPLRAAFCRENPYQLLTDWLPDPEPRERIRHEVRRQLDLVAALGCSTSDERLSICIPNAAFARVDILLDALPLDVRAAWAVVHPGGTAPSRRYPVESWAAAARELTAKGWQLVFTGSGAEDCALIEEVGRRAPLHSLADQLDLEELAALIARAPLLLAGNTGPVHLAAAAGTPVVDLYALTNPQHTPWQVPSRVLSHDVPCKYCYKSVCPEGHHACLRLVPPADVVRAATELAGLR